MNTIHGYVQAFSRDEQGQDLVEYALLAALIGLGAIASMKNLATAVTGAFSHLGTTLTSNV